MAIIITIIPTWMERFSKIHETTEEEDYSENFIVGAALSVSMLFYFIPRLHGLVI